MPGSLKNQQNKSRLFLNGLIILFSLLIGCKSPEAARKGMEPNSELNAFLQKYEKTFQPSNYNDELTEILQQEKKEREIIEAARVFKIAPPETIPGFRAQVIFTPEIEEANRVRDSLLNLLSDEWIYIVYETPYYKVRVGNFIERAEANMLVKRLNGIGYKDAWVVPDRIIKNPPRRIPDSYIQPEIQPVPKN